MAREHLALESRSKLKGRLLDFVRATGVNLNPSEMAELANEYHAMVTGWIKQAPEKRQSFLEEETKRIVKKFTSEKVYSFSTVGHINKSPDDEAAVRRYASIFLHRVDAKIEEPLAPPRSRSESRSSLVQLNSIERQGRSYRIKANITIHRSTPIQLVRRALARARRKGDLKIEEVRPEGLVHEEMAA